MKQSNLAGNHSEVVSNRKKQLEAWKAKLPETYEKKEVPHRVG